MTTTQQSKRIATEITDAARGRVLLIDMTFHCWTGRLEDAVVTSEVTHAKRAAQGTFRGEKALLRKALPWQMFLSHRRKMENDMKKITVPFYDRGARAFHYARRPELEASWEIHAQTWGALLTNLEGVWDDLIAEDAQYVGDMWSPDDYPTFEQLQAKCYPEKHIMALPSSGFEDFRAVMKPEEIESLRLDAESGLLARLTAAQKEPVQRMKESLSKLVERIAALDTDESARWHDVTLETVQELAEEMPLMNLTGDPEFDKLAAKARTLLGHIEPSMVKQALDVRASVKAKAAEILASVDAYL